MKKRMALMLLIVGLLFGGIFGFQAFKARMIKKVMASMGAPTQTVSTIEAGYKDWQPRLEAVGSLQAARGTDIAPEVSGIVSGIHFHSGDVVKAGDLLLQLDSDADEAKLHALEATADLAQKTYERDRKQLQENAISRAAVDEATANLKSAQAQVRQQRALIEKKSIRAPFAGRLGIREVDLGQYLNPGTKIVTLQALDPICVDFFLPQKSVGRIAIDQGVSVKTDAFPGQTFRGTVSAIDPKVDASTRNVKVRAKIPNPKGSLLPGMFAAVTVEVGRPQRYITLPQTAITFNPYGNTVFLVEERGKAADGAPTLFAQQKFVTTGETRGDQIAVLEGVSAGDVVVTSGQMKLRNGTPIQINNEIQPANDPAPKPKDE